MDRGVKTFLCFAISVSAFVSLIKIRFVLEKE